MCAGAGQDKTYFVGFGILYYKPKNGSPSLDQYTFLIRILFIMATAASWIWIVPFVTLAHAATVGINNSTQLISRVWDWPVGAVVAGVAAFSASNGVQLYGGFIWHALALSAGLAFAGRSLPVHTARQNSVLQLVLGATTVFVTVLSFFSEHFSLAVLAGPVPCLQSLCTQVLTSTGGQFVDTLAKKTAVNGVAKPTVATPSDVPTAPTTPVPGAVVGAQTVSALLTPWTKLPKPAPAAQTSGQPSPRSVAPPAAAVSPPQQRRQQVPIRY